MAKALKRMMVSEYEQALDGLDGLLVVDPGPMSVEKAEALRKDLREQAGGARFRLIHNRTARRVLLEQFYKDSPELLDEMLSGPSAIVYGGEGPIPIAKVVRDWKKKFKPLSVKGGVAEGEVLDAAGAAGLADLPGADELRGMLLSVIIGSARGIAGSLQAVYGGLARVLQAHIDEAGGEGTDGDGEPGGE